MKTLSKPYLALVIVSFLWGTTYIAARIGVREIPGLYMAGLRQLISGSILVAFFLLRGYKIPQFKVLKKLFFQGFLLLCMSNGFVTWSVQFINSGLAAIIAGLVPLFMALFSIVLLKSARLTSTMLVGLVLGLAGILTIFSQYLDQLVNPAFTFGICLSIVSVLSWSFGSVYSSKFKLSVEFLFSVGLQMLFAGVILVGVSLITGKHVPIQSVSADGILSLAYLIVFGSLIAYSAYVYCINNLPPTQVSVYAYINPLVAIALGYFMLDEKITGSVITGTIITLAGVYLVNRDFRSQQSGDGIIEPGPRNGFWLKRVLHFLGLSR